MNILYINHYAGSLSMGMEFRPFYFAREWKKMGHNVRIVAADFSHLRQKNPIVKSDFEIQNIDGIEYQFIKTGKYNGNGIKRALTMFVFVSKLKSKAKYFATEFNPDVIITSSTYPLDAYAGDKIRSECKKIGKRCKWIHEIHDMWPECLITMFGMSKYNPFVILMQLAENYFCKKACVIVSVLPNAIDSLKHHGLETEKYRVITNGIPLDDWENKVLLKTDIKKVIDTIHKENGFIIGFFGSHTVAYALEELIDAIIKINNKKLYLICVGNGPIKIDLINRAKQNRNILFFDSIPKIMIPSFVSSCDCLYIGAVDKETFKYGIGMNKLFDSMMSGRPILYNVQAPNNYIIDYNCGVYKKNENDDLSCLIYSIMKMSKKELNMLGKNGQQAVRDNFNYGVLSKKFNYIMSEYK